MPYEFKGHADTAPNTSGQAGVKSKRAITRAKSRSSANRFQPIDQILTRIGSMTDIPTAA